MSQDVLQNLRWHFIGRGKPNAVVHAIEDRADVNDHEACLRPWRFAEASLNPNPVLTRRHRMKRLLSLLIIILPWLAHASFHAYKGVVE